jgi:hypothetical protein
VGSGVCQPTTEHLGMPSPFSQYAGPWAAVADSLGVAGLTNDALRRRIGGVLDEETSRKMAFWKTKK